MTKNFSPEQRHSVEEPSSESGKPFGTVKGCSSQDERDMDRMSKVQELRRNFSFLPILGFISLMQGAWEGLLVSNYPGLLNGGRAGLFWCTIAVWILTIGVSASMAEMASMAPTAGGQYHWVSEFSPTSLQQPISYLVGSFGVLSWIASIPAICIQTATLVQGMVLITYPDTNIQQNWQVSLMSFAVIILTVCFNVFFAQHLPHVEGVVLFLHVFGFLAFMLVLWITPASHASASEVFGSFYNGGDWPSTGLSCMVGLLTPIWCLVSTDAGVHMAEEMKDASVELPRAMMFSIIGNGILGCAMLVTFLFAITDVEKQIINAENNVPVLFIIYSATNSKAGTCILGTVLLILGFFCAVTTVASSSRQIWAFSRDHGLPFASVIRQVHPKWEIPLNALLICLAISLLLGAIRFGSNVAFNAITSVCTCASFFSYIISIGCVRLKRLRGEPLLPCRWSLGRWGGVINDISLAWLLIGFVFAFFPTSVYTGDENWWSTSCNFASFIFIAYFILTITYYFIGGRDHYVPPVRLVKTE
ncbi:amino acid transporter [Piedraia hortae CBS 480.64]|uniref:Amino acid transporter n=1 Tax=Piedraia hortae CBS 480.64 TaxID=1314780 RepID=A0A6A7BZA9_9PEZI|nr:amino acid transporter [Piedraia hortae CBS 480.64]